MTTHGSLLRHKAAWTVTFILVLLFPGSMAADRPTGTLRGAVREQTTLAPVQAVTLHLINKLFERTVTVDETFELLQLPPGVYSLSVSADGFKPLVFTDLSIKAGEPTELQIELETVTVSLREVVVAPSHFSIFSKASASTQYLDREQIQNTPHLAGDLFRTLDSLPGVSTNDVGAQFNVRGGAYREVNVSLDGMELLEPFHLKYFADGVFSAVDPEITGTMELLTGGFSSQYGNALSGILDIKSVQPTGPSTELEISLSGLNVRTRNTFADGLGSYLFSARRGYLDLLLSLTEEEDEGEVEENTITYWDSFGKLQYTLNASNTLSFSYLVTGDRFDEKEDEDGEYQETESDDTGIFSWLSLDSVWTDRLQSHTMVYMTDYDKTQDGFSRGGNTVYDLESDEGFSYLGAKQTWSWDLSNSHFLKAGWEYRRVKGLVHYQAEARTENPLVGQDSHESWLSHLDESGSEASAFISHRFRPVDHVIMETGLRYDRQSVLDESQVSPRFNLAWDLPTAGTLRLAWGRFSQAPRIHEFDVEGDQSSFGVVETASHSLIGYEQRLGKGIDFRVEAYHKDIKDVRHRYANLFDPVAPNARFEEDRVSIDPVSGKAYGIELTLKQNIGGKFSWFCNYTYSKAEDELADGTTIPRPWDQPHSLNLAFNYRRNERWNFNLSWHYHTGWPTTAFRIEDTASDGEPPQYQIATGPWYGERLDAYHRLDFRMNRRIAKRNGNGFNLYLDVTNLYNRENPSGYGDLEIIVDDTGNPTVSYETETWLPIMPSFGFSWVF